MEPAARAPTARTRAATELAVLATPAPLASPEVVAADEEVVVGPIGVLVGAVVEASVDVS